MVLYLVGVYMLVLIAGCGLFFKDPPKNWWPSPVDPVRWSADKAALILFLRQPTAVPAMRPALAGEASKT
jgi:hypothetical protein